MKAVRIHEFGGPEVLRYEDVPVPQPGPGEIRVKVIAAGVNPVDWKIRNGSMKIPLPMTMGFDVSGIVDAIGSKVDAFIPAIRSMPKHHLRMVDTPSTLLSVIPRQL